MAREIVKAKLDVVFQKIFTDKNNETLLKSFVSDILDIPYDDITEMVIENSEITPDEIDSKFTRFDLKLTVDDKLVNVEIQVNNYGDFRERSLYYWAQRYGGQLKRGETYFDVQKTISICIVDFSIFETDSYCSTYTMADLEHKSILTDKCAMHFFELPKLDGVYSADDKKKLWMQLINSESEEELEMLARTNVPEIKQGVMVIKELSADERVKEFARRREERLREELSALGNAERRGRAEGIDIGLRKGRAEGINQERNRIIQSLKQAGMSDEQINAILSV